MRTNEALPAASILALTLILASCAKTGDPRPPEVLVPAPAADLEARQYGNKVVLTVSKPTRNTNGTPSSSLAAVELFRAVDPDAAAGGAPFSTASEPRLVVLGGALEELLRNSVLVLTDDPADAESAAKALVYAVRFLNKRNQTAGFSNLARIVPLAIPDPPSGLAATGSQSSVALRWNRPERNGDGSTPARIVGFNVYRSEDPRSFPPGPLNPSPISGTEFEDTSFQFDHKYRYSVSVVASTANPYAESSPSAPVEYDARDVFAPSDPRDLNCVVEGSTVILLWIPAPETDVAGYRVYRRLSTEPKEVVLTEGLLRNLNYKDEGVAGGRTWIYRVTAVDTHGNESHGAEVSASPR